MHEFSIITNIIEIVEEKLKQLNANIVHDVEMDVGEMAGIDFDALDFAWQHATKSALLKDAKLVVNKIEARAKCEGCSHEFIINDFYTPCPKCGIFKNDIFQGKELKVKAINID